MSLLIPSSRTPFRLLLLLTLLSLAGCRTPGGVDGVEKPDPIDIRAERLISWVAENYTPPFPNFSDAEKFYYPVALARMEIYGADDPRSNFGDPGAVDNPAFGSGILNFRRRPATDEGGKALQGFVNKDPFHFVLLGMSRLLFEHPDAPALLANRDTYLRRALERTDNYNAFTAEGTENHISMSRTAGYIYACEAARDPERFPDAAEKAEQMREWLLDWARLVYRTGDGEWNSTIYTAYNMAGWFNIFDYSAPGARGEDASVHAAARAVLDFYSAQLALHYSWGILGGAEMRGRGRLQSYQAPSSATDFVNWIWFAEGTEGPSTGFSDPGFAAIYAALSGYRPPAAVIALARDKHQRPGTYQIASPGYILTRPGESLRTVHVGRHFTMGSASMPVGGWVGSTMQIVNWKLLAEDLSGGYPRLVWGNGGFRGNEAGNIRNAWDQFSQHGTVLVQMTRVPEEAEAIVADTKARVEQWRQDWDADFSQRWPNPDRGGFKDGFSSIQFVDGDLDTAGRNRIYFPPETPLVTGDGVVFLDLDPVFVAVRSLARERPGIPEAGILEDAAQRDAVSGLLIEVGESGEFDDFGSFRSAVLERTDLDRSGLEEGRIVYTSLSGEQITVTYEVKGSYLEPEYDMAYGVTEPVTLLQSVDWIQPDWPWGQGYGRVPEIAVDGEVLFPRGDLPHVSGPLLNHEDSVMRVKAGGKRYRVDYSGELPKFSGRW